MDWLKRNPALARNVASQDRSMPPYRTIAYIIMQSCHLCRMIVSFQVPCFNFQLYSRHTKLPGRKRAVPAGGTRRTAIACARRAVSVGPFSDAFHLPCWSCRGPVQVPPFGTTGSLPRMLSMGNTYKTGFLWSNSYRILELTGASQPIKRKNQNYSNNWFNRYNQHNVNINGTYLKLSLFLSKTVADCLKLSQSSKIVAMCLNL